MIFGIYDIIMCKVLLGYFLVKFETRWSYLSQFLCEQNQHEEKTSMRSQKTANFTGLI